MKNTINQLKNTITNNQSAFIVVIIDGKKESYFQDEIKELGGLDAIVRDASLRGENATIEVRKPNGSSTKLIATFFVPKEKTNQNTPTMYQQTQTPIPSFAGLYAPNEIIELKVKEIDHARIKEELEALKRENESFKKEVETLERKIRDKENEETNSKSSTEFLTMMLSEIPKIIGATKGSNGLNAPEISETQQEAMALGDGALLSFIKLNKALATNQLFAKNFSKLTQAFKISL